MRPIAATVVLVFSLCVTAAETKQAPPYVTPQGLALSDDGKWLLHVEERGARLFRLDNPRLPVCVDAAALPGHGSGGEFVSISGKLYALVTDGLGLSVFEIQDGKLSLCARAGISDDNVRGPESLAVVGTRVYLACRLTGLAIIDVADPAKPELLSTTKTTNFARKLAVDGARAFIADSRGLTTMDVSDPTQPKILGFVRSPDVATDITVKDNLAVLGCGKNWLVLYGVGDPAEPKEVGRHRGVIVWYGSYFFDTELVNNTLHVGFGEGGYLRIDISDPAKPRLVSEYHPLREPGAKAPAFAGVFTRAIVVTKELAYLGDQGHVEVVDIRHPTNVFHVTKAKAEPPRPEVGKK